MTKQEKVTRRERREWLESIPTGPLINELQRRALAEPKLRGMILQKVSEILAVIACQYGIKVSAEYDDLTRPGSVEWGLGIARRAGPDSRSDGTRPPSIETPASKR